MKIIRKRDYWAISFALVTSAVPAGYLFLRSLDRREPFLESLFESIIIFVIFAVLIYAAYLSGGRIYNNGNIRVSPWFGFFVGGSCFLFWMGGIYADNLFYGGTIAVAAWGILLFCIWGLKNLITQKRTPILHEYNSDLKRRRK
jgi:hypothetical protein